MNKVKIAVLMSAYNGEKYIEEQIESILNQTGDFELHLFVRDDGSKDSTTQILTGYQKKGLLEWYTGENYGPAKSFIELLYTHKGYDFYAFADQDDYWLAGKIDAGIKTIKNYNKPSLYFCNTECVNSKLEPMGIKIKTEPVPCDFYSAILNPGYVGCTMVFNSALAEIIQNNDFPEVISMHDSFIARVCVAVGGNIHYDTAVHMKYRQHGDNVIGAATGIANTLKRRYKKIITKPKISINSQLYEILKLYGKSIDSEKKKWISEVMNYNSNIINRIKLAFSRKPEYVSMNMKLTTQLQILSGNL